MASSRFNNVHRQQLFHWIGSHIEERTKNGKLTDDLREEYVACLEGAFTHGIWVKCPRDPDQIKDGKHIKVSRPIACFTEWSLDQSVPHTTRYGRLGLGFPKQFVLSRGAQPLIYVRNQVTRNPYTASLLELAKYFAGLRKSSDLTEAELRELREHFDYIAHFAKVIKKPRKVVSATRPSGKKAPAIKTKTTSLFIDGFRRSFGSTLHFLEEREWRIVYDKTLDNHFKKSIAPNTPFYFLPFKSGKELFTVAMPDNRTINIALSDKRFKSRLLDKFFPMDCPHVTLVSLEDIGTF